MKDEETRKLASKMEELMKFKVNKDKEAAEFKKKEKKIAKRRKKKTKIAAAAELKRLYN